MKKFFSWLDANLLSLMAGLILVCVPLYPKLPLFDIIPGYIVRVRIEDFLILFSVGLLVLQILRGKIVLPKHPIFVGIGAYVVAGFLSILIAIFVIETVPLNVFHSGKTILHWLRRIEYFSLFFIFFAATNTARKARIYLTLFIVVLGLVVIYGYGQKYLYWPAFSTMNREYSKGWFLYLTDHARVLSTFGGHYDLAAYLVIALSLCWSLFFGIKNLILKGCIFIVLGGGFWLLILTASRASFVAYLISLLVVVGVWSLRKGLGWGLSRGVLVFGLSIVVMLSFGDLSDRFLRLTRASERLSGLRAMMLTPVGKPPENKALFLVNNPFDVGSVTSKTDQPPLPYKPGDKSQDEPKPADVTGKEIPLLMPQKTASGSTILVPTKRTYSQNAIKYDLSTGIRLDATWPRAIAGFLRNPISGSGYATLTKTQVDEFTEAESTDGDFHRSLGETGILGFVSFFGTVLLIAILIFRLLPGVRDGVFYGLGGALIGSVLGLLANAVLIDVFEASKVAETFWAVSGLTMGLFFSQNEKIKKDYSPFRFSDFFDFGIFLTNVKNFVIGDRLWISIIFVLCVSLRLYKYDTPLADWHSWRQADTSAVTRNFLKDNNINWLYPTFDDISSIASGKANPKGLRYVEFPIYNASVAFFKKIFPEFSVESSGRIMSAFFSGLSMVFLFQICRTLLSRRTAYIAALVFSLIPYNIFYGRVVLPEPTMIMFSLGGIWGFTRYIAEEKRRFVVFSLVFSSCALLVKPFAIFLLAPIGYLWLVKFGFNVRRTIELLIYTSIIIAPFIIWRLWISQFPEGIPASTWLFNGDGIRFKGAFWQWIFADRIGRLILGYWGLVLLGFGFVRKLDGKFKYFSVLFLLSSVIYLGVLATGNVRHDYYQSLLTPALSLMVALGIEKLLFTKSPLINQYFSKILGVMSIIFMLAFGWYQVRDYYNVNHPEIVEAGLEMEKVSNYKALVVAPYDGDTAFLYQTNRKGWPIMEGTIEDMIKKGAHYYVSVKNDVLTNQIKSYANNGPQGRGYKIIKETDSYVIIQLVPDKSLPI